MELIKNASGLLFNNVNDLSNLKLEEMKQRCRAVIVP